MPSNYAHYRFGAELLKVLPPDVRRTVNRYRQLYDMGLHGPDIFLYYDPVKKTETGGLSSKFHHQSGRDFFTRVCKRHRLEPSEPARAYLYGLLAHYALDAICHPFINAHADGISIHHSQVESEFDRYLLDKDGKRPAHTYDCSKHMQLTEGECVIVSGFYPGANSEHIARSVRNMAGAVRLLATPAPRLRTVAWHVLRMSGSFYHHLLLQPEPDPACAHLNGELEALYAGAFTLYPILLRQITAYLTCSVPLGGEFEAPFDGPCTSNE